MKFPLCLVTISSQYGKWQFKLKGQYHAIFSNTLKIEKTLFGL